MEDEDETEEEEEPEEESYFGTFLQSLGVGEQWKRSTLNWHYEI